MSVKIGVIGGTGLDSNIDIFDYPIDINLPKTPYGYASDQSAIYGKVSGKEVIVISRHGKNHDIAPFKVNYRANIWALKELGCSIILATTACGSLTKYIKPGDFAILDQFIDETRGRTSSYFQVCHIPQAYPFDRTLQNIILESCKELNHKVHQRVTVLADEGPRYNTRMESNIFRKWGGDVINMTSVPEAPLAAELGLVYGSLAMITDSDYFEEGIVEEFVSVDLVEQRMSEFRVKMQRLIPLVIEKIGIYDWDKVIEEKRSAAKKALLRA